MIKKNDSIISLQGHLIASIQHLQEGKDLAVEECESIIDDLDIIKTIDLREDIEIGGQEMNADSVNIEGLIDDFQTSASGTTQLLRMMITVISEGRIPKEDDVEQLDLSIQRLQKKYSFISEFVAERISEDELPERGSAVDEFVKALENSRNILYQKQLDKIRQTLEAFTAVRSLIEAFSDALLPFQKRAEDILSKMAFSDKIDIESLSSENEGPEAFMDALGCENAESQENIEILERVLDFFPKRIYTGLLTKKYYIDQSVLNGNKYTEQEDESAKDKETHLEENKGKEDFGNPVSESIENANVSSEETPFEKSSLAEKQNVSKKVPNQDSTFVRELANKGAFIKKEENIGFLSKQVSPAEEKKISSKIFLNDVRKGSEYAAKKVLAEIVETNCISSEYMVTKGIRSNIVNSTFSNLYKNGYLRQYTLTPGGSFYCASPRFIKALENKDVSKFVGVRQRPANAWGENIEDKTTSAVARIAFVNIYNTCVENFVNERAIPRYSESIVFYTDAFCLKIFERDSIENCVFIIGAFWDSGEECDDDLNSIRQMLENTVDIKIMVVSGIDVERAKALSNVLLEALVYDFSQVKIYIYSFLDRSYYTFDGEKIESQDVYRIGGSVAVISDDIESISESEDKLDEKNSIEEENMKNSSEVPEDGLAIDVKMTNDQTSKDNYIVSTVSINKTDIKQIAKGDSSSENVRSTIYSLLSGGQFYAAVAYAKACAEFNEANKKLYDLVAYAVNDPMAHCTYSTDSAFDLISKRDVFDDAMVISVAIRMFFSNQVRFDYQIKPFYNGIKEYPILNQFPPLSNVLYILMEFKDNQKRGMDAYAGYRAKSQVQLGREINKLCQEASDFYENFVVGRKKENASQKRFLETKKLMFSIDSDLGVYMKSIVDRDQELLPLMIEFLQTEFLKDDGNLSEESISNDKVWAYIVRFWDKAGEGMMYKRRMDLMSHLRSNITNTTMKAVQLLVRWCALIEQAGNHAEDKGTIAYNKNRSSLLLNLENAILDIEAVCEADITEDEKAGLNVLIYTLREVQKCIDGTFDENERRYFYAPFLLTEDIMLDENFYPDFDIHNSSLTSLDPTFRILEHVRKQKELKRGYADRLSEILDEQGDDYGAAILIIRYLSYLSPSEDYSIKVNTIETGLSYVKENAEVRKNDFIGELELAQSYGQIDNSEEDKKEKILQIIDEWYKWAVETSNYGFFKRVMDSYLTEIREEAKTREADLLEQLKSFKAAQVTRLTAEAKERRAKRIEAMILAQNYTVAEDLLARTSVMEDEHEDVIEEDFLKEFLDNYEDYYRPVATHKSNFSSLVSSRTRNKEERGAKRLADNWLPGGSRLGQERLKNLLGCLGFNIVSVKEQVIAGRFEGYVVMTATGVKDNYTHPIAAFGSGASQDGFRVVCINGGYEADGLIDLMKQIGNSKHTLILHDYALSISERRRLARKVKGALGDRFFGVVDRTVMMFLVRNYDETKINRMLISLIMPFGYYQPYVWESVNVMPPEIFMGRKVELERIKSPTGVNIVYGGRQLGKSALLKKVKEDVDQNENGDRAVYIDIKGLNCEKAAQKIGHELYDQHILTEDIDTTEWEELSRAIRKRLLDSTKEKIPYLLLLLDEADTFIESCELVNYKPMDALKDIQNIGSNRFKFVIAGLRNIVRFKRELALGNNSVLTHLESMTVKPFNTTEARELMEIPLHYLGLRFPKEKESLITLILANTNYFPGLIQMYCAKLLEAMRSKDYAGYNEVNTPIYEVSEAHIKKVLADPEFMQQIREKFVITLKLDEDNYYYLIALIMAYLYHLNGYNEGYSPEDIYNAGNELDISKITDLDIQKVSALMEELRELNVLRSTDDTHYLFTRFTFFQMMGTSSEVEDKLADYMEV